MTDTPVEKELLMEIHKLAETQQWKVLEFARSLSKPALIGVPGKQLLRFAGTINRKDLQSIAQAIEVDCERITPHEW